MRPRVADRSVDSLLLAAIRLVGADVGAIYRVEEGALVSAAEMTGGLESLAAQCLASGAATFAEPAAGSAMAMPLGDGPQLVLAVARAQTFPFQAAEVDRLSALGRLALPVL